MTETSTNGTVRALTVYRNPAEIPEAEVKPVMERFLAYAKAAPPSKREGEKSRALFSHDLTPAQAAQLARLNLAYGLDPFMGEITIYQGSPYVTIDGRVRVAQDHPKFDGMDVRPATDAEREAFRCKPEEHLWVCDVWRKGISRPFRNWGRSAFAGERNFIANNTHPAEIAMKRAKYRALRDAFALPLPPGVMEENPDAPLPEGAVRLPDGPVIEGDWSEVSSGPVTEGQTKVVHMLLREMGMQDDDYRILLKSMYDVESSQELSEPQATALIETLSAISDGDELERLVMEARDRVGEIKGRMAHVSAADLMSGIDDYQPPPPEPEPDEPVPAVATRLATKEQIAEIQRTASPSAQKSVKDWSALTYTEAEEWIDSLRQRR